MDFTLTQNEKLKDGEDVNAQVLNRPLDLTITKLNQTLAQKTKVEQGDIEEDAVRNEHVFRGQISGGQSQLIDGVTVPQGSIQHKTIHLDNMRDNSVDTRCILDEAITLPKIGKITSESILGNKNQYQDNIQELSQSETRNLIGLGSQALLEDGSNIGDVLQFGDLNLGVISQEYLSVILGITEPSNPPTTQFNKEYHDITTLRSGFYTLGQNHTQNPTYETNLGHGYVGTLIVTMCPEEEQNFLFLSQGQKLNTGETEESHSHKLPRLFSASKKSLNEGYGKEGWFEYQTLDQFNSLQNEIEDIKGEHLLEKDKVQNLELDVATLKSDILDLQGLESRIEAIELELNL